MPIACMLKNHYSRCEKRLDEIREDDIGEHSRGDDNWRIA